jgi:hypothetical protein
VQAQELQQLLEERDQFRGGAPCKRPAGGGLHQRDGHGGLQPESSQQRQELLAVRGVTAARSAGLSLVWGDEFRIASVYGVQEASQCRFIAC